MVVNSSYVQALISIIRIVAQDSSTCQDSTVNHCVISVVWKDPSLLLASSKLIMIFTLVLCSTAGHVPKTSQQHHVKDYISLTGLPLGRRH